ncbi:PepSY domain-containing protein [Aurantiacibacter sp. D1-12]|uniref:PepSY domain-containing protein n=1 Tax=Aurantiacibacter sp. D1-12 TaxID=2993658 RepID=UPI00237C7B29|nr:PepSY domain-containing protein [Aurantiacibacter sp. D1-12]MDE1468011.1 PepSY domain-containing protein [Aurantiacibacter sp. D1-12]
MAQQKFMRLFAKWHIWLGWLVGFPVLMWTVTGLVMVITPIEEVRGSHLRVPQASEPLTGMAEYPRVGPEEGVMSITQRMAHGEPIAILTMNDGSQRRYSLETGEEMEPVEREQALAIVARDIVGGEDAVGAEFFAADEAPFDFRRPIPSWQVALEDGTHIYVNAQTAEVAAVRTRWWRVFDFMWGLHIMDLQTRELDQQSPFNYFMLVSFAVLGVLGSLLGCVLMFRRRKARVKAPS